MAKLAVLVSLSKKNFSATFTQTLSIFSCQIRADQIEAAQLGAQQNLEAVWRRSGWFLRPRRVLLGHASYSSENWRQRNAQHSSWAFDSTWQASRAIRLNFAKLDAKLSSFYETFLFLLLIKLIFELIMLNYDWVLSQFK